MKLIFFALLSCLNIQATDNPLTLAKQKLGEIPTGFQIIHAGPGKPGTAKIIKADVPNQSTGAPEPQRVIEITGGDANTRHYTLLLLENPKQKDFVYSTRFKIIKGTGVRAAGIIFRMQPNKRDYYLLAVKPDTKEAFWTVFKNNLPIKGFRYDDDQFTSPKNGWQSIKLSCEKNKLEWTLNHRRDFVEYDPSKVPDYREGIVGFWVRSNSQVQFTTPQIHSLKEERQIQLISLLRKISRENNRVLTLQLAARSNAKEAPVVFASLKAEEIGKTAHEVIAKVLESRENFYGLENGVATVTVPINDRNGKTIAVVRMRLNSRKGAASRKDLAYGNNIAKLLQAEIINHRFPFK